MKLIFSYLQFRLELSPIWNFLSKSNFLTMELLESFQILTPTPTPNALSRAILFLFHLRYSCHPQMKVQKREVQQDHSRVLTYLLNLLLI